eukprot:CAMPEP_0170539268 /NCGR_PEP_ID=MMETSP0209-20121228/103817_1 /TAXON_ID=665100 ORGANISM="Litonotus pictus, Strain P1" /NCGR_SAMPLE_ID=MMETSP0209 /ASSEMBLY_ACC=CAM_ASM_000301 /LENGTH=193 /DNA_ID=CAMNT_0010841145 /DNA_START=1077 /DNA_END=1655 /DNA_ORIENTATION=+
MIESSGYLKMLDFGTAKVVFDYTTSIVGTPTYMAPEIISGMGYGLSPDYWSIGICAYEIFYNMLPFGENCEDPMEIYKSILYDELTFPCRSSEYNQIEDFLNRILIKKVNQRECDLEKIKKYAVFENFKWDELIDFKMEPPFMPSTENLDDILLNTSSKLEIIMKNNFCSEKQDEERSFAEADSSYDDYNFKW